MKDLDWNALGVTWNDDGSADIRLTFPINVGGVRSATVRMQCPSLDQAAEINQDKNGTELDRERRGMAGLMGLAAEELGQVKFPDYRRLQKVYWVFFTGTPPMFIGGAPKPSSSASHATSTSA